MLKRFTTRELVFIALISALLFLLEFLISSVISVVLGIPGFGFIFVVIFWTALALIGGLTVKKFWTFTLMALIYSLLAIPTNVFGPPGIYKIVPALIVGFLLDIIVFLFKYRKIGYYLGAMFGQVTGLFLFLWAFILFGFPGKDELLASLWMLVFLYAVLALIGAFLGIFIFNKIKDKRLIRQISG